MNQFKNNSFKKSIIVVLITSFIFQMFIPVLVYGVPAESERPAAEITTEYLDNLWYKLTSEDYLDFNFDFDENVIDALWDRLYQNAKEYVNNLTPDELENRYGDVAELLRERNYFDENLSPEFLLETYIEYNPEILRTRNFDMLEFEQEMMEFYENLNSLSLRSTNIMDPVDDWTYIFSREDGVPSVNIRGVEAQGALAATTSQATGATHNWPAMQTDAYRHWLWNVFASGSVHVGANATVRYNRTRIVTTNRELATAIMHSQPSLAVRNPTAQQIAMGSHLRLDIVFLTQAGWTHFWNNAAGRDFQMDLWNNYWGRIDARTLPTPDLVFNRFNTRWNSTDVNTGLVRGTGTGATAMSLARQNRLFQRRKHFPHSW